MFFLLTLKLKFRKKFKFVPLYMPEKQNQMMNGKNLILNWN